MRVGLLILFVFSLVACGDVDEQTARRSWLQSTLIQDNYDIILREPELSAGKFAKMDATYYNYFRGTAAQFYRDQTQPHDGRPTTTFASVASSEVLLIGDPHPENIGSFLTPDDRLILEFNDFDAARFGPFMLDVHRLGLGFWTASDMVDSFDADARKQLVEAVAAGYWNQITSGAPGTLQITPATNTFTITEDLFRRARRDGDIQEELDEYTVLDGAKRTMFYGEIESSTVEGVIGDMVQEVDEQERRLATIAMQIYCESTVKSKCDEVEVKGVSRRLGAGVSSYPLKRWYVLIEGPTASSDDDVLLEVKEIRDAPVIQTLPIFPRQTHFNNAQRVVEGQRILQSDAQADAYLGWAALDSFAFRVRHRTKYQKGFGVDRLMEKVDEGEWTLQDAADFAFQAGQLLARAHASADTLSGKKGASVIAPVFRGRSEDEFKTDVLNFCEVYGPAQSNDYELFGQLRERKGPHLGTRGLTQ